MTFNRYDHSGHRLPAKSPQRLRELIEEYLKKNGDYITIRLVEPELKRLVALVEKYGEEEMTPHQTLEKLAYEVFKRGLPELESQQ